MSHSTDSETGSSGHRIRDDSAPTDRVTRKDSAATIDRRLGEIDSELIAVEQSSIDPEHVAATMAKFTELWDVLYPQEKTRIVHLLVKCVVYSGDTDVRIVFAWTSNNRGRKPI